MLKISPKNELYHFRSGLLPPGLGNFARLQAANDIDLYTGKDNPAVETINKAEIILNNWDDLHKLIETKRDIKFFRDLDSINRALTLNIRDQDMKTSVLEACQNSKKIIKIGNFGAGPTTFELTFTKWLLEQGVSNFHFTAIGPFDAGAPLRKKFPDQDKFIAFECGGIYDYTQLKHAGQFDITLSSFMLQYLPDPLYALQILNWNTAGNGDVFVNHIPKGIVFRRLLLDFTLQAYLEKLNQKIHSPFEFEHTALHFKKISHKYMFPGLYRFYIEELGEAFIKEHNLSITPTNLRITLPKPEAYKRGALFVYMFDKGKFDKDLETMRINTK